MLSAYRRPRSSLPTTSTTKCDSSLPSPSNNESNRKLQLEAIRQEKQQVQAQLDRLTGAEDDESSSCLSCLIVGVTTCVGLSAYFAHIAYEEPAIGRETVQQAARRRPYFLAISAGWLCLGAYRLYLG